MRSLTRDESRRVDAAAQERLGLPGDLLMENAGIRATRHVAEAAARHGLSRVVVIAGPGNNGGDGFVIARQLRGRLDVDLLLVGDPDKVRGDARLNLDRYRKLGGAVTTVDDAAIVVGSLSTPAVVVDALFGTGLARDVEGLPRTVIEAIAASRSPVVAIDLPSGLDCDTGRVLGVAVTAEVTVSFVALKRGFTRELGPSHCGEVVVESIGFPLDALDDLLGRHGAIRQADDASQ